MLDAIAAECSNLQRLEICGLHYAQELQRLLQAGLSGLTTVIFRNSGVIMADSLEPSALYSQSALRDVIVPRAPATVLLQARPLTSMAFSSEAAVGEKTWIVRVL